jgi:ubiquitin-like-conjugating enzyme ATG3
MVRPPPNTTCSISLNPSCRQAGPPGRRKDHLPPNKQYLVTHRVPCRHRPKALEREAAAEAEQLVESGEDEAWVATHTDRHARPAALSEEVPDIDMTEEEEDGARDMDIDDIPGLEDMQMPSDDESDDEAARKLYTHTPL